MTAPVPQFLASLSPTATPSPKKRTSCSVHSFNIFREDNIVQRVDVMSGGNTRSAVSLVKGFKVGSNPRRSNLVISARVKRGGRDGKAGKVRKGRLERDRETRVSGPAKRPASASGMLERGDELRNPGSLLSFLRKQEDIPMERTPTPSSPPSISRLKKIHSLKSEQKRPASVQQKRPASALEKRPVSRNNREMPEDAPIHCKMCQKPLQIREFHTHTCAMPKHTRHTWRKDLWTRRAYYSIHEVGREEKSGEVIRFTENGAMRESRGPANVSPSSRHQYAMLSERNEISTSAIESSMLFTPPRHRISVDNSLIVQSHSVSPSNLRRPSSARISRPISIETSIRKQQMSPASPAIARPRPIRPTSARNSPTPDSPSLHIHSYAYQMVREQRDLARSSSPYRSNSQQNVFNDRDTFLLHCKNYLYAQLGQNCILDRFTITRNDILLHILSFLDVDFMLVTSSISKAWYYLIHSNIIEVEE